MADLTVVAIIKAKPEHQARVKAELQKLIEPTHKEEGCINYDMHQDNEDPNLFIFYENWTNKDLLDKHLESPHLRHYLEVSKDLVADFKIHEMTKV